MDPTWTSHAPKCQWQSDNAGCDAPADYVILTEGLLANVCRDCLPSYRWAGYEVVSTL